MSYIDNAPSFLPDTLCVGEVHLFLTNALLVDKFPSFFGDEIEEGCRPLIDNKCIDNDLISLVDIDSMSKTCLHLKASFIPLQRESFFVAHVLSFKILSFQLIFLRLTR
jgi:hypothetical protein